MGRPVIDGEQPGNRSRRVDRPAVIALRLCEKGDDTMRRIVSLAAAALWAAALAACGTVTALTPEATGEATPTATPTPADPDPALNTTERTLDAYDGTDVWLTIAWAPDGLSFATSASVPPGQTADIIVWDAVTLEPLATLTHPDMDTAQTMAFSPDGRYLAARIAREGVETGGAIPVFFDAAIWEVATGEVVHRVEDADPWDFAWQDDAVLWWNWHEEPMLSVWPEGGAPALDGQAIPAKTVGALAWPAAQQVIAAGVVSGELGIWRAEAPTDLRIVPGSQADYEGYIGLSPDGTRAGVMREGGLVDVWDTDTVQKVHTLESGARRLLDRTFTFTADGSLVAASGQGTAFVWDLALGERVYQLNAGDEIRTVALSTDGRWLAGSTRMGDVILWSLAALPPTTPTPPPPSPTPTTPPTPEPGTAFPDELPEPLALVQGTPSHWPDKDTLRILTGMPFPPEEATMSLLTVSAADGEVLNEEPLPVPIRQMTYSPDGTRFIARIMPTDPGATDQTTGLFDAATGDLIAEIPTDITGRGNNLTWAPDGERCAVEGFRAITLFDGRTGELVGTLDDTIEFTYEGFHGLDWSADGQYIAGLTTGADVGSRLVICDAQTFAVVLNEQGSEDEEYEYGSYEQVIWAPQGSLLLAARSGRAEVIDAATLETTIVPWQPGVDAYLVGSVLWSPDGRYLLANIMTLQAGDPPRSSALVVLDAASLSTGAAEFRRLNTFDDPSHQSWEGTLGWAGEEPWLAVFEIGDGVQLIHVVTGEIRTLLEGGEMLGGQPFILWSPDGSRLATTDGAGTVLVWAFE
ncbi:MAG: WD40 repeat domain-containing protein [Anaerolineae bacterium]